MSLAHVPSGAVHPHLADAALGSKVDSSSRPRSPNAQRHDAFISVFRVCGAQAFESQIPGR